MRSGGFPSIQSLIRCISAVWSVQRAENFASLPTEPDIHHAPSQALKIFLLITVLQISLAADDTSSPGLMFGSRLEVGYGHLHRLDRHHLGRDGADFVAHLVPFNGHVFALDAGQERKRTQIRSGMIRPQCGPDRK